MRRVLSLALAAAFAVTPMGLLQTRPRVTANIPAKRKKGLFNGVVLRTGEPLVGHRQSRRTVAQAKREAIKAKSRARNRKVHK